MSYYFRSLSATLFLSFLSFLAFNNTSLANSISDWPEQNQLNSKPFEKRFISIFRSEPDDLQHTHQPLTECDIDEDKARKLSGTSLETFEAAYKNMKNIEVEIDLDVDKLDVFSTRAGCQRLQTLQLQHIQIGSISYYQVPPTFRAPLFIETRYQLDNEMTMMINGEEHITDTEMEVSQQVTYLYPAQPAHADFPQETYIIMDMEVGDSHTHTYSATFSRSGSHAGKTEKITLSRSTTNGKTGNTISLQSKNSKGQAVSGVYGKDSVITTVDGEIHGLMLTKNFMYEQDKSLPPVSRTCYNMGKKVNIFRASANNGCIAASEDQLGEDGVYMDEIYKMQRDLEKQLAAIRKPKPAKSSVKPVTSAVSAERKKKQLQATRFKQLSSKAKCKLKNNNWTYTADNCKDGFAEGKGSAVDLSGLEFIGEFKAGSRVKGEIHQNGEMIFSGNLIDDKPSGDAICLFEKEYEECRFFRGKRIDTLYKIRKENAKNLAKIEKAQLQRQMAGAKAKGASDHAMDALQQEGMKRAASFIFDQLF